MVSHDRRAYKDRHAGLATPPALANARPALTLKLGGTEKPPKPRSVLSYGENALTLESPLAVTLAGPLENSPKFYSAFWDFGLGALFNLTFGTDSSLTTSAGWDNVTGMGTPNRLAFIRAVAK